MRKQVLEFAEIMEMQLAANDHKDGWDDSEPEYLLERLLQETGELVVAVMQCRELGLSYDKIHREAADVANFAMMIADIHRDIE